MVLASLILKKKIQLIDANKTRGIQRASTQIFYNFLSLRSSQLSEQLCNLITIEKRFSLVAVTTAIATFRLEYEDDYEYEF